MRSGRSPDRRQPPQGRPPIRWDVVVVGGGPAGLSAALVLGRCRRRVLVCDMGRPRNTRARALHGFLTRDGLPPARLLDIARAQLRRYPNVELRAVEVKGVCTAPGGFETTLAGGAHLRSRFVLLATGVVDQLPPVPGLQEFYGRGVYHCPYCDGWEMRDRPLAVYGRGKNGAGLAQELLDWSGDVVLCSDGPARLNAAQRERLAALGIAVHEQRITELRGRWGRLTRIVLADGSRLARDGLFLSTGQHQRSPLPRQLGCVLTPKGALKTGRLEMTSVPGLYAAGDCSRDVQLVVIAAAEGARAAFAMNTELIKEGLARRLRSRSRRAARRSSAR